MHPVTCDSYVVLYIKIEIKILALVQNMQKRLLFSYSTFKSHTDVEKAGRPLTLNLLCFIIEGLAP